jgi:hypothetical protein
VADPPELRNISYSHSEARVLNCGVRREEKETLLLQQLIQDPNVRALRTLSEVTTVGIVVACRGDRGGTTTHYRPSALSRIDRGRARDVESGVWGFVGIGGALAMTRSGNTNVPAPCEPFWWGHGPRCRVKDTKDGEAFRGREQLGSWPRKGKGKARNSGLTMIVIL